MKVDGMLSQAATTHHACSSSRSVDRCDFLMFVCRVPDVTIATDVICGFPTETAEVAAVSHLFILTAIFLDGSGLAGTRMPPFWTL